MKTQQKLEKINEKIIRFQKEKQDHISNNRNVSAELVQKTIDSLEIKKLELSEV